MPSGKSIEQSNEPAIFTCDTIVMLPLLALLTRLVEAVEVIAASFNASLDHTNPTAHTHMVRTYDHAKCDNLLNSYIFEHKGHFTTYMAEQRLWSKDVRGDCAGRYTEATDGTWTLSVPAARFTAYIRERGVDKQHLKRWATARKVKSTSGILVAFGSPMKIYVIRVQTRTRNAEH